MTALLSRLRALLSWLSVRWYVLRYRVTSGAECNALEEAKQNEPARPEWAGLSGLSDDAEVGE